MQEKRENNVRLISPCLKAGVLRRDPIKKPPPVAPGDGHRRAASLDGSLPFHSTRMGGFVNVGY